MIKRNIDLPLIITASLFIGLALMTEPALADCGGAKTSIINCSGTGEAAILDVIKMIVKVLTAAIGLVAVGAVIYGGILYSTSGDTPENLKKAKNIWTNVVIGLVMFAFMVAITNFIIPGGVFG